MPGSSVVGNNTASIHQIHQKRTSVVRMETVEAKEKRLAEEKARKAEGEKKAVEKKVRKAEEEKKAIEEEKRQRDGGVIESPIFKTSPKRLGKILKEALEIDTPIAKACSGPLDLPNATRDMISAPPSALAAARIIEDLGHISYPEGVDGPKPELNVNSRKGKFR